jgi:hypothetical protein
MEALPWPDDGSPGPIRSVPPDRGGYLAQPDMRRLITMALELGWGLWAYEAVIEVSARTDPAEMLTLEFSNWRDREQAPPPLNARRGVDAVVISTDNTLV